MKVRHGVCGALNVIRYSLASIHKYEEPCISGENGSGTIFFVGCNLKCIFCQNYKISQNYSKDHSYEHSVQELAQDMLNLQNKGAHNINLVTAFMYVPQIIEAINIARNNGLHIPIVYNSSGYESVETLKKIQGYVNIYLPDLKYRDDKLGKDFSKVDDYFEKSSIAIEEMYNQVGLPNFDDNGMMHSGMIIRHLILPGHVQNSIDVLKWIKEKFGKDIWVSIMAQYFPTNNIELLKKFNLNKKITKSELEIIEDLAFEMDINGFIQDLEENEEQYVPNL